jgi:hypothetical protein
MTTRLAHLMPVTARDIQFVYGNFASDPARHEPEAPGPDPIRFSAEIEYLENRIEKLTFGGQTWIELGGADIAVSDPFPGTIPVGSLYFSRTSVVVQQAPYMWPINRSITLEIGDWAAAGADPNDIPGTLAHWHTGTLAHRHSATDTVAAWRRTTSLGGPNGPMSLWWCWAIRWPLARAAMAITSATMVTSNALLATTWPDATWLLTA